MQITNAKNQNHSTLFRYNGELLFQGTLGMPEHSQLKRHDNNVAFMDVQLHAINKQNNLILLRNIGALLFWTAWGMPEQIQKILHDLLKAYMGF